MKFLTSVPTVIGFTLYTHAISVKKGPLRCKTCAYYCLMCGISFLPSMIKGIQKSVSAFHELMRERRKWRNKNAINFSELTESLVL